MVNGFNISAEQLAKIQHERNVVELLVEKTKCENLSVLLDSYYSRDFYPTLEENNTDIVANKILIELEGSL